MKNVKVLAKDKAKSLLDETVNRMKRYFQREMLHVLVEFDQIRETVLKRDKELKLVAKRLIQQEDEIVLKNTRLVSSALIEASKDLHILKLEHIDELDHKPTALSKTPFSERLDGHHDKFVKSGGSYEESEDVKARCPSFHRAFSFYGGYVSLNLRDREVFAKDQVVTYYRDCICELEDKNKVLEQQIVLLKDLNMKYSTELTTLRDKLATTDLQNGELSK
jgi:ribosomal protein L17